MIAEMRSSAIEQNSYRRMNRYTISDSDDMYVCNTPDDAVQLIVADVMIRVKAKMTVRLTIDGRYVNGDDGGDDDNSDK